MVLSLAPLESAHSHTTTKYTRKLNISHLGTLHVSTRARRTRVYFCPKHRLLCYLGGVFISSSSSIHTKHYVVQMTTRVSPARTAGNTRKTPRLILCQASNLEGHSHLTTQYGTLLSVFRACLWLGSCPYRVDSFQARAALTNRNSRVSKKEGAEF